MISNVSGDDFLPNATGCYSELAGVRVRRSVDDGHSYSIEDSAAKLKANSDGVTTTPTDFGKQRHLYSTRQPTLIRNQAGSGIHALIYVYKLLLIADGTHSTAMLLILRVRRFDVVMFVRYAAPMIRIFFGCLLRRLYALKPEGPKIDAKGREQVRFLVFDSR